MRVTRWRQHGQVGEFLNHVLQQVLWKLWPHGRLTDGPNSSHVSAEKSSKQIAHSVDSNGDGGAHSVDSNGDGGGGGASPIFGTIRLCRNPVELVASSILVCL